MTLHWMELLQVISLEMQELAWKDLLDAHADVKRHLFHAIHLTFATAQDIVLDLHAQLELRDVLVEAGTLVHHRILARTPCVCSIKFATLETLDVFANQDCLAQWVELFAQIALPTSLMHNCKHMHHCH